MSLLYYFFTTFPFMVCLFWTAVLSLDWRRSYPAKHTLCLCMLTSTVLYMCHAAYFNNYHTYQAVFECIYAFCNLMVFPLYYLYIKRLSTLSIKPRTVMLMVSPAVIITLWAIGIYAFSSDYLRLNQVRMAVMRSVFVIQVVVVSVFGLRTLRDFDRMIENFYSNSTHRLTKQTRNLMAALIICSVISAFASIIGRSYFDNSLLLMLPSIVFGILLFGIGYVGSRQQFSIDDLATDLNNEVSQNSQSFESNTEVEPVDATTSAAPDSHLSLGTDLEKLMVEAQVYLNNDLKLTDLAQQLRVGRTMLSNYINKNLGMSFADYVNSYRVQHAQNLMLANRRSLSISQIAEESGFTSDNTFYRAFRRVTGVTPRKWLESINHEPN